MSYSELIIALENIIVDKVSTVPSSENRRIDTSAPMEIGMAAKEDGESASQEKKEIIELWISRCRLSTKQKVNESWASANVRAGTRRVAKVGAVTV